MPRDLEEILRPVGNPMPPFPPKRVTVASGEEMVIRQATREEIPGVLRHVAPLVWVETDFLDVVASPSSSRTTRTACRTNTCS